MPHCSGLTVPLTCCRATEHTALRGHHILPGSGLVRTERPRVRGGPFVSILPSPSSDVVVAVRAHEKIPGRGAELFEVGGGWMILVSARILPFLDSRRAWSSNHFLSLALASLYLSLLSFSLYLSLVSPLIIVGGRPLLLFSNNLTGGPPTELHRHHRLPTSYLPRNGKAFCVSQSV